MDKLRSKRAALKGTTTRLEKFFSEVAAETSVFELKARLEKLEVIYEHFQTIDLEMAALGEPFPEREEELDDFEARYFNIKARCGELIEQRAPPSHVGGDPINSTTLHNDAMQRLLESQANFLQKITEVQQGPSDMLARVMEHQSTLIEGLGASNSSNSTSVTAHAADVRLPKLNIPNFDGKYAEFKSFFDLFNSSVHENSSLTAAQKFQYLKGFLKGDPAMLIRHLAVTAENYEEARTKLKERYDKPALVVNSLITTFLAIPKAEQTGLRNVANIADEVIRGLRAHGTEAEKRDPWLIHLLLQKVDRETYQAWAERDGKSAFPTIDKLFKFLNERCDAMETVPKAGSKSYDALKHKTVRSYSATANKTCWACQQRHHLAYCPAFIQMNVATRINFVKEKRLCFNCLYANHGVQNCQSKFSCQSCNAKHHSLLHIFANTEKEPTKSPSGSKSATNDSDKVKILATVISQDASDSSSEVPHSSTLLSLSIHTLLPTANALIKDNMGNLQRCNILLDSGSQKTLISEACAQRLGLPRKAGKLFVEGLGNIKAGTSKGIIELEVHSTHNAEVLNMSANVFKSLTSKLPTTQVDISFWDEVQHLPLADPHFNKPKQIDLLVGSDYFFSLMRDGQIKSEGRVCAQNTALGWIVCGGGREGESQSICHLMTQTSTEDDLISTLQNFWKIESLPNQKFSLSSEDQQAEDIFSSTTIRSQNAYQVRLPFKVQLPDLGSSYTAALRRLLGMERRFSSNPSLQKAYTEFMREYADQGHMERVPSDEIHQPVSKTYYLPHHAVHKDCSLTTKLRVVFDGSCKTSNGKSLNDNLLKGPPLHQDLFAILIRYRCNKYCFSADIKQMFRMIQVQECDRNFQRILWRESPDDDIQHYRLNTVTYGTTPAPFLSIRTLHQLSEDEKERYPLAAEILKRSFYVDDCMSGGNTLEETKLLVNDINNLLTAGGFKLRKWTANDPRILSDIPNEDKIESIVDIPSDLTVCLLGVIWNPQTDCFSYKVECSNIKLESKRQLLSEISKLFDPLGWISPAIIAVKIIIQRLWLLKLEWDDPLPKIITMEAKSLFDDFHVLNNAKIPRFLFSTEENVQFHGFCDASTRAYAAVIYCRRRSPEGVISNIVIAKTKVAPIAEVSIPRLELCAAQLLAQLFAYLADVLDLQNWDLTCWSDSKTVLAWLSSHPRRWKPFISNRTSYILETLPSAKWRYVPTKHNPADCASRGIKSSFLIDHDLWFQGPKWLQLDEAHWPKENSTEFTTNDEIRPLKQVTLTSTNTTDVIATINERTSQWTRLVRVFAFCLRACRIWLTKIRTIEPLTTAEIKSAENQIYKYYQEVDFKEEIYSLTRGKIVSNKHLKRLSPFIDSNAVLRVGGRLNNSDLAYENKHQVILHKNSLISRKIVRDLHVKNLHSGITQLLATIRQTYWIIGAREVVKSVIQQCGTCHRHAARANEQLMGSLPKFRVNAAYPFFEVGCDYAGPIMFKQHNGRRPPIIKAYVAVFICLTTKAVHLELVTGLDTEAFMAALNRFVSRRGLCARIHSDNGTNFVGAARKLNEIQKGVKLFDSNHISDFLCIKGIQWKFIPPGAPHFGGIWESTVKSMKSHLRRVLGQAVLNFEELTTLLTRIEAILNSRPLVQSDSDDLMCITPGHFLIGRPLNAVPEVDESLSKMSTLTTWRLVQQLTQSFWHRWSSEYLASLQPKNKWLKESPNVKVNDVVLLREEHLPPTCWKLGRIIETHAGSDGLVRVVTIKTQFGVYKRPITKICPLPKDG